MNDAPEQDYRIYLTNRTFDPYEESLKFVPDEPGHYIVQFVKPLTREEQTRLRSTYGLRLTDYLPNLAFLEWLEPQTWKALAEDPLYRSSVPYEATDKISPEIGTSEIKETNRLDERSLLLRAVLFPDAEYEGVVQAIASAWERDPSASSNPTAKVAPHSEQSDGRNAGTSDEASEAVNRESAFSQIKILNDRDAGGDLQIVFALPSREPLSQIASLKEVRWIEEVKRIKLDAIALKEGTPAGMIQSGSVGLTPVWDQGIHGEGQVIGVTDSLVETGHCMFSDPASKPVGPAHRKIVGNRQNGEANDGHGHVVAALATGFSAVNHPVNKDKGMAWAARLSLDGATGIGRKKCMFSVLKSQLDDVAFIHSNSWHEESSGYTQIAVDVDNFVWLNEEHFVCGSSGNDGEILGPPGLAKNALCVSASKNFPHQMEIGDGGSKPINSSDNRLKPEICAPGCNIFTATHTSAGEDCTTDSLDDCASSWATPIIAGAAALVRQYYLDGFFPTGREEGANSLSPSAALVKASLLNSTVDMTGVKGYPSSEEGWGLVRLINTLFFAGGSSPRNLFIKDISNSAGVHTGEIHSYQVNIKNNSPLLKITLVWSDAPALSLAAKLLVNNLDLIVTSPDGKKFSGNNLDETGFSREGEASDDINNVEMVIVEKPSPGLWTITVKGTAVNVVRPGGGQGYALVLTAAIV
jgi:hypothetical protein